MAWHGMRVAHRYFFLNIAPKPLTYAQPHPRCLLVPPFFPPPCYWDCYIRTLHIHMHTYMHTLLERGLAGLCDLSFTRIRHLACSIWILGAESISWGGRALGGRHQYFFFFMYDDDVSREIRERELEDVVVL